MKIEHVITTMKEIERGYVSMNAKEHDNNAENMINIYTSLEVLEALSEKEYDEAGI